MTSPGRLLKKPKKDIFTYLIYFFMVATPLFELPQAISIYTNRSAEGVSLWTWGFFFMTSVVWLIYAIRLKLLPLIVMYSLYILAEASVVIGIFTYS